MSQLDARNELAGAATQRQDESAGNSRDYLSCMGVASALYPVIALALFSLLSPLLRLSNEPLPELEPWLLLALVPAACLAGMYGVMIGIFVRILWQAICLSLGLAIDHMRFVARAGGLVGLNLLGIVLAFEPSPSISRIDWLSVALTFFFGPGIATPLFQFAGGWSEGGRGAAVASPRVQFGIRQVLIATAWIAGFLTILKALGLLTPLVLVLLLVWIVYQWCTLELVLRLLRAKTA